MSGRPGLFDVYTYLWIPLGSRSGKAFDTWRIGTFLKSAYRADERNSSHTSKKLRAGAIPNSRSTIFWKRAPRGQTISRAERLHCQNRITENNDIAIFQGHTTLL